MVKTDEWRTWPVSFDEKEKGIIKNDKKKDRAPTASSVARCLTDEFDGLCWPRFDRTFVRYWVTIGRLINSEHQVGFIWYSLPDGSRSIVYHWRDFYAIFDSLRDIKNGQRHCAWDEHGCVCQIEARANSPPKSKSYRPGVLLRFFACRCDIALRVELGRVGVNARVTQHLPGLYYEYWVTSKRCSIEQTKYSGWPKHLWEWGNLLSFCKFIATSIRVGMQ